MAASPPQQAALQFLGTPILMGVAILLLTSFLQNLVTGGPAARFPVHLFRFAMITVFLSAGANSMQHALFLAAKIPIPRRPEGALSFSGHPAIFDPARAGRHSVNALLCILLKHLHKKFFAVWAGCKNSPASQNLRESFACYVMRFVPLFFRPHRNGKAPTPAEVSFPWPAVQPARIYRMPGGGQ